MRTITVFGNILLTLVAVAGAVVFALPVIGDLNDGRISAVNGAGPASAAMVYVLLVPMLASLGETLVGRLSAILVSAVSAIVTRFWVALVEGGQAEAALLVLGGVGIATAFGLLGLRLIARRRRRQVEAMARLHGTLVAEVAKGLRRRYAGSPDSARPDGPLNQAGLVEHLVAGVIAEAATAADPVRYADVVLAGLTDLRDGLDANRRTDPNGYGAIMAGEYLLRLRGDLRRRLPDATPLRRPAGRRSPA